MAHAEPRDVGELIACLRDARGRTLALLEDLDDEQWLGPELASVNPPLWEIGHVAWFQERWTLRHLRGRPALRADADELYDSAAVAHDTRWRLALPTRARTLDYVADVLAAVERELASRDALDARERYFHLLALFHEDMHGEAFVYTRQTLGYREPAVGDEDGEQAPVPDDTGARRAPGGGPCPGDVELPGGVFRLGAEPADAERHFVFDNEQWAHEVRVAPFRMARAPVTQAEFRAFVEDRGYERRELWSDAGWEWRVKEDARQPKYWKRDPRGTWLRRHHERWVPLEDHLPAHHVNAHEAEAFCRWAGRRLPTEAEWEFAAGPALHPWGDEPPTPGRAHLDLRRSGPCEVGACPDGDSPYGLRQMTGNVWEWTASEFGPYPGFAPGPYREYSEPWFGWHRVLRGGAFATRSRLLRNTWRNFYTPDRRDVLAGFRTCAL